MKNKLRSFYNSINEKYPFVSAWIRRFYYRKLFNTVRRRVSGRNNTIRYKKAILSSVVFDAKGNNNVIEISEGCIINNVTFYLRGDNHRIMIGKDCKFMQGGTIWLQDMDCTLTIGQRSTFEDVHLAVTEPHSKLHIGEDCMFAYDIDVRTGDSHSIISLESNKRINYAENISIGDHVWIAAHCVVLKGSCIPDNSVVATGSIVTQCYGTPGIIIGGNPSKQIKDGITWSRKRIYDTS